MYIRRITSFAALSLTGASLFAGCGSSSKPAYCKQVTNFKDSVKSLEKQEISVANASGVTSALEKVGTSAKELASAVKTEFAPQITALKSSFGSLEKSVAEVANASGSARTTAAVAIPKEVEALKHATAEIQEVTKSKCE